MAQKDGERKMLFDIRGRRKNVVKVVYAVLAILMGVSLLLVTGPIPFGDIFGNSASSDGSDQLEEQAERIERKLKKDPENPQLLLNLTRTHLNTANTLAVVNPQTGEIGYTPESRQQLSLASEAWSKYLRSTDEPSPALAQLAAQGLFGLAQTARTGTEASANVRASAKAQQIFAAARPSLGSLSTLAIYRLYAFDYDGAAEARKDAATYANSKFERENLGNELDQIAKRARAFEKQLAEIAKETKQAREKGESASANPLAEENPLGGG